MVDLVDLATEIGKGTVVDADGIAQLESDLDFGSLGDHALLDRLDTGFVEDRRLVVNIDEAGDARRVAQRVPGLIVQRHANENIAGEKFAQDRLSLPVLDFDLFLGRHDDLKDAIAQIERFDAGLYRLLDFVLVAGIGVEDKPLAFLVVRLLALLFQPFGLAGALSGFGDRFSG